MPRNGSGGYSPPSNTWNPAVNGVGATAADWETLLDDMSDAIAGSVAADGQTPMTGNLNAGNNRLTAVASATARTDAITMGQVQDGSATYLTAVAGTNTITASLTGLAAYAAGQAFRFVAANANTGAVTLNINTLGAKAITRNGATALIAGDILAGQTVTVIYDGTQFQLSEQPATGRLIGEQYFTASGTYTPTVGTRYVVVEVQAPGGGSGGCVAAGTGLFSFGYGGGGGGWAKRKITSGFSGVTVTVGAAGAAGASGAAGGTGGTTSFGSDLICTGGAGGTSPAADSQASQAWRVATAAGGAATSSYDIYRPGGYSGGVRVSDSNQLNASTGGSSYYAPQGCDSGLENSGTSAAIAGVGYGAGATGPVAQNGFGAQVGAAGGPGIVVVYEYA